MTGGAQRGFLSSRPSARRQEQAIHHAVVAHLRARGVPGLVYFHVPNGGKRSRIEAAILAGLGVRAGVPDLILVHRSHVYGLELKRPGGRPSVAQMQFLSDFNAAGGTGCIVDDLNTAVRTLEVWGLLRGAMQ